MIDKEYIKVLNRGKIAYLYMNNIFEDSIQKEVIDGQEQFVFVFKAGQELFDKINEYNENLWLKQYNKEFKNIAFSIAKLKSM